MEIRAHGGGCCGLRHLVGFNATQRQVEIDGKKEAIPEIQFIRRLDELLNAAPPGRLIEAVLTDVQATLWTRTLRERKFVLTTRFRNANSGNYCNVFHWMKPDGYSVTSEKQNDFSEEPLNKGIDHPFVKTTYTLPKPKEPVELIFETDAKRVDWTRPVYFWFDKKDDSIPEHWLPLFGRKAARVYSVEGYAMLSRSDGRPPLPFSYVKGLLKNRNCIRVVNAHPKPTVKNPFAKEVDTGRDYI